ncbi:MAG: hypothetical protein ACRC7N_17510 [Clostridium sp.]
MEELLTFAFLGVNIIPTILLLIILLYWIMVILGVLDLDLFDFDVDGVEDLGASYAIISFLNLKEIPLMLVISIQALYFWIFSMLLHLLKLNGGLINGLVLIPTFIVTIIITKFTLIPLKSFFTNVKNDEIREGDEVVGQTATLISPASYKRIGQAQIKRDGASILINVKTDDEKLSFEKGEEVYVVLKDEEKNIYYIIGIKE